MHPIDTSQNTDNIMAIDFNKLQELTYEIDGLMLLLDRYKERMPQGAVDCLRKRLGEALEVINAGNDRTETEPIPVTVTPATDECIAITQENDSDEVTSNDVAEESPVSDVSDEEPESPVEEPVEETDDETAEQTPQTDDTDYIENNTSITDYPQEEIVEAEEPVITEFSDEEYGELGEMGEYETVSDDEYVVTFDSETYDYTTEPETKEVDDRLSDEMIAESAEEEESADADMDSGQGNAPFTDISRAFTINDKFRFKRELFGNSDAQYVETIDVLSAMTSLDEIEEYIYDDLEWDRDNEDVKAFIEVITNYFNMRHGG